MNCKTGILKMEKKQRKYSRSKRNPKNRNVFKFYPYRISKVEPVGNILRGIKCPEARSGHRIVADCSNVYSFGGYNPNLDIFHEELIEDIVWIDTCCLFKELWKFNIASQTWSKLATKGTMPEELASHAAVLVNNHILIFGGTGVPFGMTSSNNAHICNLKSLEWNCIETSGQLPLRQYGQAIALHNNGLYVVGGTTGFEYSMDVHYLDFSTKKWKKLNSTSHPEPRYRHEIAVHGNQLFVFGGGTATDSFGFKEILVFDLDISDWKLLTTSNVYPKARRCHGCVQLGSDVYICGGHDGVQIFSDIWRINLKKLKWEKLPCELPTPVYFHSATLSPLGEMFIFGGVSGATNVDQNTRTNDLYSMWLKVPSLSEMCWMAVLHYIPNISQIRKEKLYDIGIPPNFLKRIDFSAEPKVEVMPL